MGIQHVFRQRGAHDGRLRQKNFADSLLNEELAGYFSFHSNTRPNVKTTNQRITERLKQAGIPVVLLDRDIGVFPHRSEFDIVGVDNVAGGYLVADHLIKLGVRRMVYVKRPLTAPTVDSRSLAHKRPSLIMGWNLPQPFVYIGDPADVKFVSSFAQNQKIDAILCTNDHLAAETLSDLDSHWHPGSQRPSSRRL